MEEADLNGDETLGGRRRSPTGTRRSYAGRRTEEQAEGPTPSGRRKKEQKRTQGEKWVPKEFGRSPRRDDPSCASGTTQHFINKGDSGILWTPEESRRHLQEDAPAMQQWQGARGTSG
jgi:hypothetical protein